MKREATRILDKLGHGSFIFNLGHGVVPQTPPEHVAELVETVRTWKPLMTSPFKWGRQGRVSLRRDTSSAAFPLLDPHPI